VGKTPTLVVDKTFKDAKDKPDLSFATLIEPAGDITDRVIAALPKPDVKLDSAWQRLTYNHRSWSDAEMYFFFNESNKEESRVATIAGPRAGAGVGPGNGRDSPISAATAEGDSVHFPLVLDLRSESRRGGAASQRGGRSGAILGRRQHSRGPGRRLVAGPERQQVTGPLKSWQDLGTASFAGPATYRKQFTVSAAPAGKRLFLEIADVHDYARVKLNGKELEGHAWQPYRWDVTSAVKPGSNDLEVEVRASAGGRGAGGTSGCCAGRCWRRGRARRARRQGASGSCSGSPGCDRATFCR